MMVAISSHPTNETMFLTKNSAHDILGTANIYDGCGAPTKKMIDPAMVNIVLMIRNVTKSTSITDNTTITTDDYTEISTFKFQNRLPQPQIHL
jgi:hypothetical protein